MRFPREVPDDVLADRSRAALASPAAMGVLLMRDASQVEIYTDGACLGNPGPGGWAALLVCGAHERTVTGGAPDTTNNRMELMAAISGLEALKRPCAVLLVTDSQYVKRGVEEWMAGWRRNGWRTSSRQPVKNRDLWERLDLAIAQHTVRWEWVRGHTGHPQNERVDELARAAALAQRRGVRS